MGSPIRLLAVTAVRNEMRFLPGFIANVGPHVDGIVALDDGSTDGSTEYLASRPEVIELLRVPPNRPAWDEVSNHRALVSAALRRGGDWLLAVDADERLEREFGPRCAAVIREGMSRGNDAYAVPLRELWGSWRTYRGDGAWGRKKRNRLFLARADHEFDTRPLHAHKAPLQAVRSGPPVADLIMYHLRMIRPEDRLTRRRRYETLDPETRYQRRDLGYSYLTDESGLRLVRVDPDRDFVE